MIIKSTQKNWLIDIVSFLKYRTIPAKLHVKIKFKKTFGFNLNLRNPKTFNEKIQWKKFYDHNFIYPLLSDKLSVRKYITQKLGQEFLIPLIAAYKKPSDINFDILPEQFVIKPSHGSGQVIIVTNKRNIDKKKIKNLCRKWLKTNFYYIGKEWQYKDITPTIIIEEFINDNQNPPNDYKFFCFNGKVSCVQVDSSRFSHLKRTFFDLNWNILPFTKTNLKSMNVDCSIPKPLNLDLMVKISEDLSKNFDFVRIDLYDLNNKVYFGEFTFTPGSGYSKFYPNYYDTFFGEKIKLSNNL